MLVAQGRTFAKNMAPYVTITSVTIGWVRFTRCCGKMFCHQPKQPEDRKVLANNCVSEIKVPEGVGSADVADFSPALGLYVTYNYDYGVAVWDPDSRKVIARFKDVDEFCDTLFLPGDRLAVSSSGLYTGGTVDIYTFDKTKSKPVKSTLEGRRDLPMSSPGALALSPNKTVLLLEAYGFGVYEVVMDWNNLKVIKSEEIDLSNTDEEIEEMMLELSCSPDFKVATYNFNFSSGHTCIRTAKVCFISDGKIKEEEHQTITYYMLDGERRDLSKDGETMGCALVHDGQHLIIANRDEIVLLESMTEGSNAHLIASNITPSGQMRINHEGQLMVCEETVIKLFEYKCNPKTL